MKEIEELTLRLLDDELDEEGRARLDELIESDPEARAIHLALVEQEAVLRGERTAPELAKRVGERIEEDLASRVEDGVMDELRSRSSVAALEPIERLSPWLGRRGALLAMAAAVLLVAWTGYDALEASLTTVVEHEVVVYGQDYATPGLSTAYRAFVRDGATQEALPGATVAFRLTNPEGETIWEGEQQTDESGFALAEPELPADSPEGDYQLSVVARSEGQHVDASRSVHVERSFRLFLATDKPRYQPGQVIHLRSLALHSIGRSPVADREVLLEVADGRGNKVFKRRLQSSDFGLASADFQLADQVNMGEFRISATIGDTVSERSVTVERYVLPTFRVEIETNQGYYLPGDEVSGTVTARYTFGEPVANAEVELSASAFIDTFRPFQTITGRTDAEGRLPFELRLADQFVGQPIRGGDALVSFEASVTDGAGRTQQRTLERTVTDERLRVDIVPESGETVQGVDNIVYVVTSYPDGRPASATVTIAGVGQPVVTDASGFGQFTLVGGRQEQLTVEAVDSEGVTARATRDLIRDSWGARGVLLRTDQAVYRAGDSVRLSVLSAHAHDRAFVDVVQERQTVSTQTVELEDGHGEIVIDLSDDMTGTLALSGYVLQSDGEIGGDTKLIQVAEAEQLDITTELDREVYRPADTATLSVQVRSGGEPTVAALSLWGVDEAVFALQEMRPGLERVYFALQEELLTPRYEIHGHEHSPSLLADPYEERAPHAAVVVAAAQGIDGPSGTGSPTFDDRMTEHGQRVVAGLEDLESLMSLLPALLVIALMLVFCAYAAERMLRGAPIAGASDEGLPRLKKSLTRLLALWVLGIYGPLAAGILAGVMTQDDTAALVMAVLTGLGILVAMISVVRALRRDELTAAMPNLRRVVWLAPLAYVGTYAALTVLTMAMQYPRTVDEDTAIVTMLVMLASAVLVTGAISVSNASILDRLTVGRGIWRGLSRSALAGAPLLVLGLLLLTPQYSMNADVAGAGMAMEELDGMPPPEAMMVLGALEESTDTSTETASGPLSAPSRIRRHFPETLLWEPELITDAQGRAQLEIPLADSITTWRVGIGAVSSRGQLGSETLGIRVFQPFFVDVDLPVELTQNDAVQMRVAVYNYLDEPQTVRIEMEAGEWLQLTGGTRTLSLAPREVTNVAFPVVAKMPGEHRVTVRAYGSEMGDAVERVVRVAPDGEAIVDTRNGQLEGDVTEELEIPDGAIVGANGLLLKIYPGGFSQVMEGLDGILRMPSGCFEQTSSATYPNILVLDYLRSTRQASPEVEMRALQFINTGYQRLLSYEVPGGGFEWFGQTPAHTVLTAYGLMEFSDMAEVSEVDPDVISRTRQWLLDQQQSDGSFRPTEGGIAEGAINAFEGQDLRTTAYIAWALGESGATESGVGRALDYVSAHVGETDDPYTLALAANAMLSNDRNAEPILRRLDALRISEEGLVHWTSESEGVTYSLGNALDVETTALVAYAYQKARFGAGTSRSALAWLVANKDPSGTWNSTQATVHAMRALLLGATAAGDLEDTMTVAVNVNGQTVHRETITPDDADVFRTIVLDEHVQFGANRVELDVTGTGSLAYQLVGTHYRPWAPPPLLVDRIAPPLDIEVSYDTDSLAVGDELTANVTLTYNREGTAQMTLVDLGIPPGFDLLTDAFDAMQASGQIERYNVMGRQVTLYFRTIQQGQPVEFSYRMQAQYPLRVQTPSTVAYQYYEPAVRDVTSPVELTVR